MVKYYCDICKKEITPENGIQQNKISNTRLAVEIVKDHIKYFFEVIVGTGGVSNHGNFCRYCILDALYTCDDRKDKHGKSGS